MNNSTIGIILAAGKGTRMNAKKTNKTALNFNGKPMIRYGAETFLNTCDQVVVVVGFASDSVKSCLSGLKNIIFATQKELKGTGDAVKSAIEKLSAEKLAPKTLIIGYGDHLMHVKSRTIKDLMSTHKSHSAALTLLVTSYPKPSELKWGRVVTKNDKLLRIVEEKDATREEKKIDLLNPGLYCVDFQFIISALKKIHPSEHTGEYYLTDIVEIAAKANEKIAMTQVDFSEVGIGVNTPEQLKQSQQLASNS